MSLNKKNDQQPEKQPTVQNVQKPDESSIRDEHRGNISTIQDTSDHVDDVVYSDGLPSDQHMRRRNPDRDPSSWRNCRGGGEGCIVHGSEKNWMSLMFVDGYGCPCRVHQSMCPPPWGNEY